MTEEVEEIVKANLTDEMTDEQFVQTIVKANLPNTDEIVKAAVEKQVKEVDEIRKAMETSLKEIKDELTKIKEQPIMKSAVIIPEQADVSATSNYAAFAEFNKRG